MIKNGLLFCTDTQGMPHWTEGKVYLLKDGKIRNDFGNYCPVEVLYENGDTLEDYFIALEFNDEEEL